MSTGPRRSELKQLNAYLLKSSISSDADAIKDSADIERYPLRSGSGLAGALFVRRPQGRVPPWASVVAGLVDDELGELRNRHVSAVLVVQRGDRWVAVTFGFGRFLLRPDVLEVDFGLKVAASLVDPDSVTSVDSRSFEERVLQTRRQSSDPSAPESIGLDTEREMLRAVTGSPRDLGLGRRVSGSVGAGLTTRTSASDLGARLDTLLEAYTSLAYQGRFPHIDRWQTVDDPSLRDELDEELMRHLRDSDVRLALPEIVAWENAAGFTYTGARDQIFATPELADYLDTRREEVSLAALHRHELKLLAADEDQVINSWPIYKSLLWETTREDTVYALIDGNWVAVNADYVARIDERLGRIATPRFERIACDPVEHEEDYNRRLAEADSQRAFLDAELARFEGERGGVEMCDVFTPEGEFIHVKRSTTSKALSHLFAQGATSADLLRNLPAFRDRCRTALAAHPHLARLIPEERPAAGAFEVAYLVITSRPDDVPTKLPFFSRSHLARVVADLERLEMRVSIGGVDIRSGARPPEAGPPAYRQRAEERAAAHDAEGDG